MNHGKRAFIDPSAIRHDAFYGMFQKDEDTGCWNWQKSKNFKGYGQFTVLGKCMQAHRVSYVLHYGEQPNLVMHLCDNPACVNPEHLQSGDNGTNMRDAQAKGRINRPRGMRNLFELVATANREFERLAA